MTGSDSLYSVYKGPTLKKINKINLDYMRQLILKAKDRIGVGFLLMQKMGI